MESIINKGIGFYGLPMDFVFYSEPYEVLEVMKECMNRMETEHNLSHVAMLNAIGRSFAKNYKYIDLFEKKKVSKKIVTDEERAELVAYLESW